jgi:hypothetical protein
MSACDPVRGAARLGGLSMLSGPKTLPGFSAGRETSFPFSTSRKTHPAFFRLKKIVSFGRGDQPNRTESDAQATTIVRRHRAERAAASRRRRFVAQGGNSARQTDPAPAMVPAAIVLSLD